jgi:glycosyltransferase involved in cell wall biosynthesis
MKVLALMTNTEQTACTRFRLLQYKPHLEAAGITLDARPLLDEKLEDALYRSGSRLTPKAFGLMRALAKRTRDLIDGLNADVVYVLREASLVGPPIIEWALSKAARRPIVFDLDDPIWKSYSSPTYGPMAMLFKMPKKAHTIFRLASHVVAGNDYVANYAKKFTPDVSNVSIVPTVVDTDVFTPKNKDKNNDKNKDKNNDKNKDKSNDKNDHGNQSDDHNDNDDHVPVVGWIGSHSTAPYLRRILPALQAAAWKAPFKLHIVGSRSKLTLPGNSQLQGTEVVHKPWTLENEVTDFQSLDIGLYPITRDKWSVGKSAFKAVQYGAVGIPTVASPVGAVEDVVQHEKTGFLANTTDEWIQAITTLVKDAKLRRQMGQNARKRIVEHYSLATWAPKWIDLIQKIAQKNPEVG